MSKTSYVWAWGEHANCILLVVRQEWKPLHHCDQSCNAIPKHHGRYCSTQILCYLLIWKHTDARARFFTDIHGHRRAIHTHLLYCNHIQMHRQTHTHHSCLELYAMRSPPQSDLLLVLWGQRMLIENRKLVFSQRFQRAVAANISQLKYDPQWCPDHIFCCYITHWN